MKTVLRPLELDFCRTRRAAPWAGPLLAVLALALSIDVGFSYARARAATVAAEQRIAEQGRPAGRAAGTSRASSEELAAAREVYERLAIPWESLFHALESTTSDKIALLGIEPDAKTRTVLISGEAVDYPATLNYLRSLEQGGALKQAHLVRHELRQGDASGKVAFSISASWKDMQ